MTFRSDMIHMECKCKFAQHMVGDGCDICNPSLALEHAREEIADLQLHVAMMADALRRLMDCYAILSFISGESELLGTGAESSGL